MHHGKNVHVFTRINGNCDLTFHYVLLEFTLHAPTAKEIVKANTEMLNMSQYCSNDDKGQITASSQ